MLYPDPPPGQMCFRDQNFAYFRKISQCRLHYMPNPPVRSGQHSVVKHINISAVECMTMHLEVRSLRIFSHFFNQMGSGQVRKLPNELGKNIKFSEFFQFGGCRSGIVGL